MNDEYFDLIGRKRWYGRKTEEFVIVPLTLQSEVLKLPPREAVIVVLRFGLDGGQECTLEECGQIFEMSPERVRQLEQRALERLRASFGVKVKGKQESTSLDDLRGCIQRAHPFGASQRR